MTIRTTSSLSVAEMILKCHLSFPHPPSSFFGISTEKRGREITHSMFFKDGCCEVLD